MLTPEETQLIDELGLSHLPEDRQHYNIAKYYDTLNLRLSMVFEDRLSDEQLAEFEKLHDAGDDEAIQTWLHQAITDYDQVVADEEAALKQDIKRTADDIRDTLDKKA